VSGRRKTDSNPRSLSEGKCWKGRTSRRLGPFQGDCGFESVFLRGESRANLTSACNAFPASHEIFLLRVAAHGRSYMTRSELRNFPVVPKLNVRPPTRRSKTTDPLRGCSIRDLQTLARQPSALLPEDLQSAGVEPARREFERDVRLLRSHSEPVTAPAVRLSPLLRRLVRHNDRARRGDHAADAGKHDNWHSIEVALRFQEDLSEARDVLDNRVTRGILDRICERATGKPAYGKDFLPSIRSEWQRP
jgi:hypothetical protein